jgi:hypothetical protein
MKACCLAILLILMPSNLYCQQFSNARNDSTHGYSWDKQVNQWAWVERFVFTWDSNGHVTDEVIYDWYPEIQGWIKVFHRIKVFDANGYITEMIYRRGNIESNGLENSSRYVYTRDAYGNRLEEIVYDWDPQAQDWVNVHRWAYFFDARWGNNNCTLHPNPGNGILTIETQIAGQFSIEVTSLNGKLVYSTRMDGDTRQVDLSFLGPGVYLVTVRSPYFLATEKFIKL